MKGGAMRAIFNLRALAHPRWREMLRQFSLLSGSRRVQNP